MSLRADHAATIIAAADVRRRVSSQDHHLAAGRDGQAGNSRAHPATRTLILNRNHNPPQRRPLGVHTSGALSPI
jgi:hypothetical protein